MPALTCTIIDICGTIQHTYKQKPFFLLGTVAGFFFVCLFLTLRAEPNKHHASMKSEMSHDMS